VALGEEELTMAGRPAHAAGSRARLLAILGLVLVLVTAPGAGVRGQSPAGPEPATLEVWLGGILTTATPGSPFRTWVDEQVARFTEANPGSSVNLTLLPADNSQLAAQVQAAFGSGSVPDVMMLYSGSYTLAYEPGLLPLNDFIDATPGFYDQMSGWDASCVNLDCQDGQGTILAVPADVLTFVMFYNKALFEQAGVDAPGATYDEIYAQCDTFNAAGLTPIAYGDLQGWTTDNYVLVNLVSWFEPGDVQAFAAGELKFTDPKWVEPLRAAVQLREHDCVQDDATTRDQFEATTDFVNRTAAMIEGYPQFLPTLEPALGDDLAIAPLPYSGSGSLTGGAASNSGEGWVIPKGAQHPELAWEWIKTVSDEQAGAGIEQYLGIPPANRAAHESMTNPHLQTIAELTDKAVIPLMDNVMSQATALVFYREIQQAFAGTKTPEEALQAVQDYQDQEAP
jgi:raffinose/stachyose/melibiose transport system substrate-binding protein